MADEDGFRSRRRAPSPTYAKSSIFDEPKPVPSNAPFSTRRSCPVSATYRCSAPWTTEWRGEDGHSAAPADPPPRRCNTPDRYSPRPSSTQDGVCRAGGAAAAPVSPQRGRGPPEVYLSRLPEALRDPPLDFQQDSNACPSSTPPGRMSNTCPSPRLAASPSSPMHAPPQRTGAESPRSSLGWRGRVADAVPAAGFYVDFESPHPSSPSRAPADLSPRSRSKEPTDTAAGSLAAACRERLVDVGNGVQRRSNRDNREEPVRNGYMAGVPSSRSLLPTTTGSPCLGATAAAPMAHWRPQPAVICPTRPGGYMPKPTAPGRPASPGSRFPGYDYCRHLDSTGFFSCTKLGVEVNQVATHRYARRDQGSTTVGSLLTDAEQHRTWEDSPHVEASAQQQGVQQRSIRTDGRGDHAKARNAVNAALSSGDRERPTVHSPRWR